MTGDDLKALAREHGHELCTVVELKFRDHVEGYLFVMGRPSLALHNAVGASLPAGVRVHVMGYAQVGEVMEDWTDSVYDAGMEEGYQVAQSDWWHRLLNWWLS